MPDSVMKHINISIRGRVQNVGFRFSCMEAAYKTGITGFVKNRRDGTLYIEAEGTPENIEKFIQWCSKGPIWAKVHDVHLSEGELQHFKSFEIIRK
ncbi:MAG: acylphosphatase [Bacteroidales bacterium]|nr:acylphosphatase [Bacteroidales bacterium]